MILSSSWYQQMVHQNSYIFIIIANMHCYRTMVNYFSHCIFPFARKLGSKKILCQYAAAAALSHPGRPEGGHLGDAGATSTFRGAGGPKTR